MVVELIIPTLFDDKHKLWSS